MDKGMLGLYTDYLICSTSYTTATGLSRVTDKVVSHDRITRFLSEKDFTASNLWEFAKPIIRSVENEDGVIAIDDSIEEKPYTDENDIVAWHYDHKEGRTIKGINFVTALLRTEEVSIPLTYCLVKKTVKTMNKKTGKEGRKSPITKQQMYRDLLSAVVANNVLFKYVVNDVWFASTENMCFVKDILKKDFVMPLKENRKVALSKEDLALGKFVSIKKLELGEGMQVWLADVDFPLRLVCQHFKNEDGSTGVLYLVSSNIELTYEQITAIYKKRWKVEEYHKSLKINASLAKSPTKTVRTQANHIFAAICAFMKLESLSIAAKLNHFALKDKIYISALQKAFLELNKIKMTVRSKVLQTVKGV